MKRQESWFIVQRAMHLAILHLTRRNDLLVSQSRADYGLDLLVEIYKNNRASGRMFGVQVKASKRLQILSENASERNTVKISFQFPDILEDLPFPLCIFIFQMSNDEGYYKWMNEPIISDEEKSPKLILNRENIFKRLTRKALDEIVWQIDAWYEKRYIPEYQRSMVSV